MVLWRIANQKYALDTSCEGAKIHGGRWNSPGRAVFYAGCSIEIAALEKYVHLNGITPASLNLELVRIEVPDDVPKSQVSKTDLPKGWNDFPSNVVSQQFGDKWLKKCDELVLIVPSVIIPEACNALINHNHVDYKKIKLSIEREFQFDPRM